MTIEWTGDLEDDCTAHAGGMEARCECMGEIGWSDGYGPTQASTYWHCSVYTIASGDIIFDSGYAKGLILGGDMSRAVCEAIMRGYMKGGA